MDWTYEVAVDKKMNVNRIGYGLSDLACTHAHICISFQVCIMYKYFFHCVPFYTF